jgi:hypothetical protein
MSDEEFTFPETTPELETYLDLSGKHPGVNDDTYHEWKEKCEMLRQSLAEGLLSRYYKAKKVWMCRDATASKEPKVFKTDSEKYELHVTSHSTGKGTWAYTKGKVFAGDKLLTEVCRNYSSFPFRFIENHPNGHSYLICGEDYQGQTVIELDTGRRRDFLPKEAKEGHGFCWSSYEFHAATQILVVDGCYWACPYEFKFYDFSDPMEKGWPLLETECYIDADRKAPILGDDGVITTFETRWEHPEDEDNDDFDEDTAPRIDAVIRKFKREDGKLTLVSEWVSEDEQKRRKEQEEAEARWKAWEADFKANDPLYLAYQARMKSDTWLSPSDYHSYGVTYDNWCPDWKERETRWCRRIHEKKTLGKGWTMDFEWAVKTGPVKLQVFKDGNTHETKFFPHSVEGVNAAFDYAKDILQA